MLFWLRLGCSPLLPSLSKIPSWHPINVSLVSKYFHLERDIPRLQFSSMGPAYLSTSCPMFSLLMVITINMCEEMALWLLKSNIFFLEQSMKQKDKDTSSHLSCQHKKDGPLIEIFIPLTLKYEHYICIFISMHTYVYE